MIAHVGTDKGGKTSKFRLPLKQPECALYLPLIIIFASRARSISFTLIKAMNPVVQTEDMLRNNNIHDHKNSQNTHNHFIPESKKGY